MADQEEIRDILNTLDDEMSDEKKRLAKLKAEVEGGLMPIIHNASWGADRSVYYMGDVQNLGWMEKDYVSDPYGDVGDIEWFYTGPEPIRVETTGRKEPQVVQPNSVVD